ncbi:DUF1080 domain-containing protein [Antarcticibacterium sp. 1MA-6-2]|uniref:DUF1080 domain-containing protein n=1 Tax=Antarcticibacterium sp. 1MA-6-2 TaxID=2908210 RepID=UPI001F3461F8|nr:DUF1080 domain-containing protein [Antarcticibacterium sp. 1MA-6-2]UJH90161.1 DUF1080 domain-containing protein [Antarcticibacterium sp. 1MA-6-2]
MQKIIKSFLILTALFSGTIVLAQRDKDQRTLSTKIADVLAELLTESPEEFSSTMANIGAMGEEGILALTKMLVDPETGDNTNLEYALGGFSFYVTQPEMETLRQMSVSAYCSALPQLKNVQNKSFIIRQLKMVGGNDAISCLEPYLNDSSLCAPAAEALININSSAANEALLKALENSQGDCQLSLVQAIGDVKYAKAGSAIIKLAGSDNEKLRKLSLYALANIGDPASEKVLRKAAEDDGFSFDNDNAISAYLLYGRRLLEQGDSRAAEKVAKRISKRAKDESRLYSRTASLKLLTDIHGEGSVALLRKATEDKNAEYRAAALKYASNYITPENSDLWIKKAKKSNPQVEAEIIKMLGDNNANSVAPEVIKALDSKNTGVQMAAINALGKIGDDAAVSHLLNVARNGDKQKAIAVRDALFIIDAKNLTNAVADALPQMSNEARAALLPVLGKRAASDRIKDVINYAEDPNDEVRTAALAALVPMARKEDLPQLFSLLKKADKAEDIKMLQKAVIAGINEYDDQTQKSKLVLEQMNTVSEEKKALYFPVLASIGGTEALNAVASEFDNTNYAATKAAAINALSAWSDNAAATELFRVSQDEANKEYKDKAVNGYISSVSRSNYPDVQKLLLLRKAFDASGIQHKKLILQEIGKLGDLHSLTFAGEYLEEPLLQQEAARAVMEVALNNNYDGQIVKQLLNKTIEVLEGAESEYLKQSIVKHLESMPEGEGFVPLFNGKDLSGWKGLVANPVERAKMSKNTLNKKQQAADEEMRGSWKVENGELVFTGKGNNIATTKNYGDFELILDWKIYDDGHKNGDAGIYLRGTPQVQMWDISRVEDGAQVGSGGLYNNQTNESDPLEVADNPLGEWNHFKILMKGDRVTVHLNGKLVTDNVTLENYWDRKSPIFSEEQIELQAHGSRVAYRDIYIREIAETETFELSEAEKKEGFKILFDGTNMDEWQGNTRDYVIEDGNMVVRKPEFGSGGNLFTRKEYDNFIYRFEFKLTPGANNGLGIRAPLEGDVAYHGMELQILDNTAEIYKDLKEYQYHGSLYGVAAAQKRHLKQVGEWNYEEVIVEGNKIKVNLNGHTILETDISEAIKNGTLDGKEHPGLLRKKGHIGFLGHGSEVYFRNIRIKEL